MFNVPKKSYNNSYNNNSLIVAAKMDAFLPHSAVINELQIVKTTAHGRIVLVARRPSSISRFCLTMFAREKWIFG